MFNCTNPVIVALALSIFAHSVFAERIGVDDFTDAATIETFDGLSLPANNGTSLTTNGHTIASPTNVRYLTFAALNQGQQFAPQHDEEYIDFTLENPMASAGIWVVEGRPTWASTVFFYSASDTLLGSVELSGVDNVLEFAAWRSTSDPVSRIRVLDVSDDSAIVVVDNLTLEAAAVPTPASGLVTVAMLAVFAGQRQPRHHYQSV